MIFVLITTDAGDLLITEDGRLLAAEFITAEVVEGFTVLPRRTEFIALSRKTEFTVLPRETEFIVIPAPPGFD